ncbi:hypothetical protein C0Q70_08823 [Pomacea canaliculata]|uniref:Uncharacterized protein n=1 Tax=Pomacea canaliculata TaxID=400727 RepID=A0A2T7P839_POMCA|nr:hypothetical protein C0Q70_08823 [Pomacea canaliculata]
MHAAFKYAATTTRAAAARTSASRLLPGAAGAATRTPRFYIMGLCQTSCEGAKEWAAANFSPEYVTWPGIRCVLGAGDV